MPDGRSVGLENHCVVLTPTGKSRQQPVALGKETATSNKISDWGTLPVGKACVEHDCFELTRQIYDRRETQIDQKHNPPWFKTHFVPRFRLHPGQRVLGQGFIKHHPTDAGSPTLIAGGPHSDSSGTSHGEHDPAVTL